MMFAIFTIMGCAKMKNLEVPSQEIPQEEPVQLFADKMVLGEKLNNPYSLSNMRSAYLDLIKSKASSEEGSDIQQLQANCLYVRFLPKDSTDVAALQDLHLELFDYPLDYDILVEGEYYHDPSIPEDEITWQYTTVSPDFVFPEIPYEILDECFIPDDESDDDGTKAMGIIGFSSELEKLAILKADLPEKFSLTPETKGLFSGSKPSGTFRVYDDSRKTYIGIKGAKIRCHFFVNWSTAYTNESGYYSIGNKYLVNPHYAIVYDNIKGFTLWGNWAFLAAANHDLGYRSKNGYSQDVQTKDNGWKWAVVNNAAYEYYKMCANSGIKAPPSNLKIWCWNFTNSSSTPMLRHLFGINVPGFVGFVVSMCAGSPIGLTISAFTLLVNRALPDVTIGMNGYTNVDYARNYCTVWHELSHASHFSQIGEKRWGPYINYIVTNGGYGDGSKSGTAKDICGLSEAWAYANQRYTSKITFGKMSYDGYSFWFSPYIESLYNLLESEVLSRKQIFDCLTYDVVSFEDLKTKLISKYPSKKSQIDAAL